MITTILTGLGIAGSWLKSLPWKWIAICLAVAGVLYVAYSWAYNRGSHSRDAEVTSMQRRLGADDATIANLRGSIKQQNAAVDALKVEGDRRVAASTAALDQAKAATAGLAKQAEQLRASAKAIYAPGDPCVISKKLQEARDL